MRKRTLTFIVVGLIAGCVVYFSDRLPFLTKRTNVSSAPSYAMAAGMPGSIRVFDPDVSQISQIDISSDGTLMFVGTLSGTIWVYKKTEGTFVRQKNPFFAVDTAQPGFPPQEAGLTGVALGADFESSGDVFLLYSYAQGKKDFRNRITRVTSTVQNGEMLGTEPIMIFEANTPGASSHQIQDGIGILVNGKPHLFFTVGEGFKAARALDVSLESGKAMLIGRDGSAPEGTRPYPQFPKIQAIGVRNAPGIARNPASGFIAIADTGPTNYDRLLYGAFVNTQGNNNSAFSLMWDGSEDSLKKSVPDVYSKNREMVLHRWAPTETAVNIVFYTNDTLPALPPNQNYVLVTLFGKTGDTSSAFGRKILLGVLDHGATNRITFQPLIERTPEGKKVLGHPLGLAADPQTNDIYFGDIMEGRIYTASLQ